MSVTIDLGVPTRTASDFCPDWVLDRLPVDASRAAIISATVDYVTGELRKYRSAARLRTCFIRWWPFLEQLAVEQPEQFDAILLEYAERSTCVS